MEDKPSVILTTLPSYEKHDIFFKPFSFSTFWIYVDIQFIIYKEKCVCLKCTHQQN